MLKSPAFSTSFLESRMIQKLKSRKSRIKPGLFAFLLAERIIFGKKTQKPAETLRFCRFSFFMCCMVAVFTLVQTSGFCIRLHLSATALISSSTQNAPGFAFFGSIRVRFLVFRTFGRAKFRDLFLYTLSHSVHRLKSLVMPVRREVSFLA